MIEQRSSVQSCWVPTTWWYHVASDPFPSLEIIFYSQVYFDASKHFHVSIIKIFVYESNRSTFTVFPSKCITPKTVLATTTSRTPYWWRANNSYEPLLMNKVNGTKYLWISRDIFGITITWFLALWVLSVVVTCTLELIEPTVKCRSWKMTGYDVITVFSQCNGYVTCRIQLFGETRELYSQSWKCHNRSLLRLTKAESLIDSDLRSEDFCPATIVTVVVICN